jgi:adenylate kinase
MQNHSTQRLVCVFGVSGVGKSTMLRDYVASHPGWMHLIAGDVLSAMMRQDSEALRTSGTEDIQANQRLLVERILEICARHPDKRVLLDAHCVIDNGAGFVKVPVAAIEDLPPDLLVCVWDEAARIQVRRACATDRIRPERTVAQLDNYQKTVVETCEEYGEELDIELVKVRAGDGAGLADVLSEPALGSYLGRGAANREPK